MRYALALAALLACDTEPGRVGRVEPVVVTAEPAACNVCVLHLDADGRTKGLALTACPGVAYDGWCAYLGCDVACLPDEAVCARASTCGHRP